jgi:hypothetical protein
MEEVWRWFGGDASVWDAIGSIGTVLVAIGLIIAILLKARAVIAQARAGQPHIEAADRRIETGAAFADKETFPNLLVGVATTREGTMVKDTLAILNMGGGNAKDLRLRYRDSSPPFEVPLDKQVLAIRDVLPVPFDSRRGATSGFQLTYKTTRGTQYALEFEWDANDCRAVNERLTVISSG